MLLKGDYMKIKLLILMVLALTVTACGKTEVYSMAVIEQMNARIIALEKQVIRLEEMNNTESYEPSKLLKSLTPKREYALKEHCHSTKAGESHSHGVC